MAGLNAAENSFVIEQYFAFPMRELQVSLPNKRQAAIEFAYGITDEIMQGKRDVFDGIKEIKNKAIDSYDFFSETIKELYDSIGFNKAYALYDAIDELLNGERQSFGDKTNDELIKELKQDLFYQLRRWRVNEGADSPPDNQAVKYLYARFLI